ncbi:GvpL/GvpF family gas vesicle protein [Actinomadura sp. WMMA1423]|uniref:GvpL/GvpF family gas vesicle protein n=1 Tax=Actinomadura sp. WMMA1423 TaxID=2591108 RepID=UPI0011477C09|nr:GvpL/GvpF family gas vesicle protein [Actinomadura sp. WMMA1423]
MTALGSAGLPGGAVGAAGTGVYLYGVAWGLDPAALDGAAGVAGAPVRGVVAGGLTALVSTVRLEEYGEAALRANLEDLQWLEATARAHHDVVERAARSAPTAPVRIATIYRDDARVAAVLAAEGERLREALDLISGRSEWGVRAYASPELLRGDGGSHQDPGGGLAPGAEPPTGPGEAGAGHTRRRRRRADAGRLAGEQADSVHAELADHAAASRHHPPQDPRLSGREGEQILNAAYLLDEEQVEGFLAVTRAARERLPGIEVEVTGPWPPYSFIDPGAA